MSFITQGKTNWKFLLIVVVLAVVAGGAIWLFPILMFEKLEAPLEEIIEETEKLEEIIEEEFSMSMEHLQAALEKVRTAVMNNEREKVEEELRQYQQEYYTFQSLASSLDPEKNPFAMGETILKVRLGLWNNYQKFLGVVELAEVEPAIAALLEETKENWEKDLKDYMITANGKIIVDLKNEKKASFNPTSFLKSWVFQSFFVQAQSEGPTVIHKKVYYDSTNPGEQGELIGWCWRYESWIDIEQRSGRWEASIPGYIGPKSPYPTEVCRREVNIYEKKTGKDLMLDLDRKYAEWIHDKPDKHGLGGIQEGKSLDPLVVFREKLETGEYILEGTEVIEETEVYVVRFPIYNGQAYDPERKVITRSKEYQIIYVAAHSYLPIRKMQYYELLVKENEEEEKGYWEKTLMHNNIIEAEMIYSEELPENFFLPEVPEDYEMIDFSGVG